jgi:uncharacterized protein (DUF1778 family)
MPAHTEDEAFAGAKTVKMEQRTTPEAKQLIEQAAGLLGVNASEFTVSAAVRAARQTLKEHQATILTRRDHAAFVQALEATEPTADLQRLMSFHSRLATP